MAPLTDHADELVATLTRAAGIIRSVPLPAHGQRSLIDAHGNVHADGGTSIGGQFIKKLFGGGRKPKPLPSRPVAAPLEPLPPPRPRGTGPGNSIRHSLADASSASVVSEVATAEARQITGRDVPFDFEGSDPQIAREHAEGVLRGLERFPNSHLARVRTGGAAEGVYHGPDFDTEHVYARTHEMEDGSGHEIIFDRKWSGRPDEYREALAVNVERRSTGSSTVTGDPMGNAIHEIGHVVDRTHGHRLERTAKEMLERFFAEEGLHPYEGDDELERYSAEARRRIRLGEEVSRISVGYDRHGGQREMAAEVFADVMVHGDDAARLSRVIFDAFEDEIASSRRAATGGWRRAYAKTTEHTGAMVALVPTPADADRLALDGDVDGREPADELHLTLWYLGDAADIPPATQAAMVNAVRSMVERRRLPPIEARAFGAALWNPDGPEPVWVLNVGDLPDDERPDGQERLAVAKEMMSEAWYDGVVPYEPPAQHTPWAPHICVAYSDDPELAAEVANRAGPVTFDRIRVAFAGRHTDIPLVAGNVRVAGGPQWKLPCDGEPTAEGHVRVAGGPQYLDQGRNDDGEFTGNVVGGFDDPLNMRPHAMPWTGEGGDTFEGSARIDGTNGGTVAMMFMRERTGDPYIALATLPASDVAGWRADDEDDSIALVRGEEYFGELAEKFDALVASQRRQPDKQRTLMVSGADIGSFRLQANTADGEPGIDFLTASYLLGTDDKEYHKERREIRAEMASDLRSIEHDDDDDSSLTPEDWEEYVLEELSKFDVETEDELRQIAERRARHTVRLSPEQATAVAKRLRDFGTSQPTTRSHRVAGGPQWIGQDRDRKGKFDDGIAGVPLAALNKVKDALSRKFGGKTHITGDRKGVHITVDTKHGPATVTVTPLDFAMLALGLATGGVGTAARLAMLAGKLRQAAKLAKIAKAAKAAQVGVDVAQVASKVKRDDPGRATVAGHRRDAKHHSNFQNRDEGGEGGGEFAEGFVSGAGRALGDALKLAGRVNLDPGEEYVGSGKVDGDSGVARIVATRINGLPAVQIAVGNDMFGSREDDAGPWRGGKIDLSEVNAERDRLATEYHALAEMDEDEWTPEQQARIGVLEDTDFETLYPNGYAARLDTAAARRLHGELSAALAKAVAVRDEVMAPWEEIERMEARRDALGDQREPLREKYTAFHGHRISEEYGGGYMPGEEPVPGAPALTPEEDAELSRLTDEWMAAYDRIDEMKEAAQAAEAGTDWNADYERSRTEGVIPGEWADIHYDVYGDDFGGIGVEADLLAVPHGMTAELLENEEVKARFDVGDVHKLLRLLERVVTDSGTTRAHRVAGGPQWEGQDRDRRGRWANAIAGAGTITELNAAAGDAARRITGGRDVDFDMTGLDLDMAREMVDGVLDSLAAFPKTPLERVYTVGEHGSREADDINDPIGSYGGATPNIDDFDETNAVEIRWNTDELADVDKVRREMGKDEDKTAKTIRGMAIHEFGHVLAAQSDAGGLLSQLIRSRAGKPYGNSKFVEERVSWYATWDDEFPAEIFAMVRAGERKPSPFALEAYELLSQAYRWQFDDATDTPLYDEIDAAHDAFRSDYPEFRGQEIVL